MDGNSSKTRYVYKEGEINNQLRMHLTCSLGSGRGDRSDHKAGCQDNSDGGAHLECLMMFAK